MRNDDPTDIAVRLADLSGNMKVLSSEMRGLAALIEKDVAAVKTSVDVLRVDHERFKASTDAEFAKVAVELEKRVELFTFEDVRNDVAERVTKTEFKPYAYVLGVIATVAVLGIIGAILQMIHLPIGVS